MRVVITAGGTSEMIDSVRSITNKSSGKLLKLYIFVQKIQYYQLILTLRNLE